MAERIDIFTFTVTQYIEPNTGVRWLGRGRYAVDIYKISFILEFWFWR